MSQSTQFHHLPVMADSVMDALALSPTGIYVDGTFGRGGHSSAILSRLSETGRLIAFDRDNDAILHAKERFSQQKNFSIIHGSFADIMSLLTPLNVIGEVDGLLLDLGVSSPQLDDAKRGFSFRHNGPLDMRFDAKSGQSAAVWLNSAEESEIGHVIKNYGEERFYKSISRAIVKIRADKPLLTTHDLVNIILSATPKKTHFQHKHPATRTFQAIRIHINKELEALSACLEQSLQVLKVGGRLVVLSFHSLEDRIVKHFIKAHSTEKEIPSYIPIQHNTVKSTCKLAKISSAIKASSLEIAQNKRARSAILRIASRIA